EASIGKAHLREMGIRPWRECQPDAPDWLLATILETYYGGRAECGVPHPAVPGVLVDFVSPDPTVFCLLRLWDYYVAEGVEWTEEDPATVQRLLEAADVAWVLRRESWPKLQALVLIAPDGDQLPTRAKYRRDGAGRGARTPSVYDVA